MQVIGPGIDFPKLEACWFLAPGERDPSFLAVFAQVSLALQNALRERVPAAYFTVLENYRDVKKAYPLLIYQASRPFRGRVRTELTYDFLSLEAVARLARSAKPTLVERLSQAEVRLREAGWPEVADHYRTRRMAEILESAQSWSKSRRCLQVLMRDESALMNALIGLGGLGRQAPREQARRIAAFEKRWCFQLRRFYPGTDFLWLAPVLLGAVTEALHSLTTEPPCPHIPDGRP
ncbi:MAG TPA: hypothetical protein VEV17_03225 [Bryobacteraceae bacterium]|nr:hypothetical protein [Bryobacteraceae bacterium]